MAHIKDIHVGMSYTYSPAAYHSVKGEVSMTVEVNASDDPTAVELALREAVKVALVADLAGIADVHEQIYKKGLDPEDMLSGITATGEEDEEQTDFEDFFGDED